MTRTTSAALLLALAGGCGPSTATVAGKVSYQGKPLAWGSVTLIAADGSAHQAGLEPDGSFRLDLVPTGPARVGVSSPDPAPRKGQEPNPRVASPPALPPGAWFPLPDKFANPQTSGLTVQVGGGPADLDLK